MRPTSSSPAVLSLALCAAALVLAGCDLASAGNTLILDANSSNPLEVRHRFEYDSSDVLEGGRVEVGGTLESDNLGTILATYGVSREQVVSAQVDSVALDPVSTGSLSEADLYLGTNASGPLVASVQVPAGGSASVTDSTPRPVTAAVRAGVERVFGRFIVDDPGSIPPGGGVVPGDRLLPRGSRVAAQETMTTARQCRRSQPVRCGAGPTPRRPGGPAAFR